jgi:hypothetical protein
MNRLRLIFLATFAVLLTFGGARLTFDADGVNASAGGDVVVRVKGSGAPSINLRDGRTLKSSYRVQAGGFATQPQELTEPLALATADLDEDGVQELISGYAGLSGGKLTLHHGNLYSIYPHQPGAEAAGREPFLSSAVVIDVTEAPDLIATGDFDGDGHADIATAARGGHRLNLMAGDGQGNLRASRSIKLPGAVTALAAGEVNRRDGLADLVVGVTGESGAQALVFQQPEGALRGEPEVFKLPAQIESFALENLDDDSHPDIAAAAENAIVIIHGRERNFSPTASAAPDAAEAEIERVSLPFSIKSLMAGDFLAEEVARAELAVLGADGAVHLLRREEKQGKVSAQHSKRAWESATWTSSLPLRSLAGGRLLKAQVSSRPGENLLLVDQSGHQIHVLSVSTAEGSIVEAANGSLPATLRPAALLEATGEPVAVLPMRLNSDGLSDLVILQKGQTAPTVVLTAPSAIFVVNSTINDNDCNPGDGICAIDGDPNTAGCQPSSTCTLQAAIQEANALPGADLITFNIGGGGPQTINTGGTNSGLGVGDITETVTIDATTQPGFAGSPLIELNGGAPSANTDTMLTIASDTTAAVVRGLVINRLTAGGGGSRGSAIAINGGSGLRPTLNIVEGNYLGTNVSGTATFMNVGNPRFGISVDRANSNTIGGTTAAARNFISGHRIAGVGISSGPGNNSGSNLIKGNFIGTDVTGTSILGNGDGSGFNGNINIDTENNTVGGTEAGARNLISGGNPNGISITGAIGANSNLIQGNLIGSNLNGTAALGNVQDGIRKAGSNGNTLTIGGTSSAARNVISGNGRHGILLTSSGALIQGNFIGTAITGSAALANGGIGIFIDGGSAGSHMIGGTTSAARNIIAANGSHGIAIDGSDGHTIQGNFIGTNATGTAALGNGGDGVFFDASSQNNTIGGTAAGAGNLISGNSGNGIFLSDPAADNNVVQGNLIGTRADAVNQLGNGADGVRLAGGVDDTRIGGTDSGARNIIAFNSGNGVTLLEHSNGTGTVRNPIRSNNIFSNGSLGIDLGGDGVTANDACDPDFGGNNLQNFPVLTSATSNSGCVTLTGTINSTASTAFTLDFYANPACDGSGHGEGQTFLGSATVTTDANCQASFSVTLTLPPGAGQIFTATATDPAGNTSEFSQCRVITTCSFTLAPTSRSFAANGGTSSVNVTTQGCCNWMATSNAPWLTITSGASGNGNGTVNYSVATNSGAARSAILTIAGQTFTVLQGSQFSDVPANHPFYDFIGKLSARGITLGCGGGNYCPDANVTREQMAIFIERALGVFTPPPGPATPTFADVSNSGTTDFSYEFIEDFALRGITAGCQAGPPRRYCPTANVTREQMAIFIERALGVFTPPPGPATPTFADVPNSGATDFSHEFIEDFVRRGITAGCQAGPPRLYCPSALVTRGQMAVFLVRAFNL